MTPTTFGRGTVLGALILASLVVGAGKLGALALERPGQGTHDPTSPRVAGECPGCANGGGEVARPAPPAPPPTLERQALEGYFPNVPLITEKGEKVLFYDDCLKDKVVLINFMFTTCRTLCPRATDNLVQVQRKLGERVGRDVFMYSVTVDPETDTPEVLERFAAAHGVGPGWRFLTGTRESLRRVREKLGSFEQKKMNHTGLLMYGNESTGKWLGIYVAASPDEIVQAVLSLPGGLATAATTAATGASPGER